MSTVDLANRDVQPKGSEQAQHSVGLRPKSALSVEFFSALACVVDAVAIVTAIYAAYRISDVWTSERLPSFATFSALVTVFCLITLVVYRTYRLDVLRAPLTSFAKIYFPFLGAFAVALFVIEATVDPVLLAADWPVSAVLMGMVSLATGRVAILFLLMNATRSGWIARRVAILGGGEQGRRLIRHIQDDHLKLNRVIGVFDDRTPCKDRIADNLELSGDLGSLVNEVRKGSIDDVILALPWHAEHRLRDLITELEAYAVNVRLSSDLAAFQFPGRMTNDVISGLPMLTISSNPLSGWRRIIKAIEDRVLGTLILILFAPVMLVVAAAIKLESPGPILFRQKRLGFNNKSFEVYKFRSMVDEDHGGAGITKQATRDDRRVTRVGKFIRRTSLDELPQLFNVIEGSMSLVGPRPHALDHNVEFGERIDNYFARHKVKPGITGLAQINGLRGETDTVEKMEYRVRYDLFYIENWSVLLDLEILALSAFIGFFGKNAY